MYMVCNRGGLICFIDTRTHTTTGGGTGELEQEWAKGVSLQ